MTNLLTNYNFLRSFGELSSLEQLTEAGRVSLLQKIISSGQSETSWRAILELFASWPQSAEKEQALKLANQQLGSWDDKIRSVNSAWIYLYNESELSSLATIARFVNINNREQNGNKELSTIVGSEFVSELTGLTIVKSEIFPKGIKALVSSPFLQNLKELTLDRLTLRDSEFTLLFDADNLPQLRELQLRDVGLNVVRLKLLLASNLIRSVSRLDVSYNNLGDEAVDELIASTSSSQFRSLNLEGNFVRANGATKLLERFSGDRLRELNISRNEISANQRGELQTLSAKSGIKLIFD